MSQCEVNAIAGHLTLGAPQAESLERLASAIVASPAMLKHGGDNAEMADVLKVMRGQFAPLQEFERNLSSTVLCHKAKNRPPAPVQRA